MQNFNWRITLILAFNLGSLAWALLASPIPQDLSYHNFADKRAIFGVPNFFDVISNVLFFFVGWAGIQAARQNVQESSRPAWIVFFVGILLIGIGSAFYHWTPDNFTLVWDRLPMTVGFMGLFVALLSE